MATWAHSRIESFRSRPRKYFCRYVRRAKPPEEPEPLAQFPGQHVHQSLDRLYAEVRRGRTSGEGELAAAPAPRCGLASPPIELTPSASQRAPSHRARATHARPHDQAGQARTGRVKRQPRSCRVPDA